MLGDMFLWLVANLKQGVIYFIKQALPPNISAGSVFNPIPTSQVRNQPLYERHVPKSSWNRVDTYGHCDLWKQISLIYQKFIYKCSQGLVYRSSPIKGVWPSSLDQSLPLSFMPSLHS